MLTKPQKDSIAAMVANRFDIEFESLFVKSRKQPQATARQIICTVFYMHNVTQEECAKYFEPAFFNISNVHHAIKTTIDTHSQDKDVFAIYSAALDYAEMLIKTKDLEFHYKLMGICKNKIAK